MIHQLNPKIFHNEFKMLEPRPNDYALCFLGRNVLVDGNDNLFRIKDSKGNAQFLFEIDEERFFLVDEIVVEYIEKDITYFRYYQPQHLAFAVLTGSSLYEFYRNNTYCGRCGMPMQNHEKERSKFCTCGHIVYPKIAPAVIVGILDEQHRLLCTKYRIPRSKYHNYSLVAGYNEIGETLEDTVRREVYEEVGLRVKDIQYFDCQPWPITSSLVIGFFCKVDGSTTIRLDQNELCEATWFTQEDLFPSQDETTLTHFMIDYFRQGKI